MELWQWGKIHGLMLSHPLGRIKLLRPLLSSGPFRTPGDGTTINMGFYRHSNPYEHTVGASLRFIIDVGRWQESRFVLAAGQSGHPFTSHYSDQTSLWRAGRYTKMEISPNKPFEDELSLRPSSANT
jgi:penicillin amidase